MSLNRPGWDSMSTINIKMMKLASLCQGKNNTAVYSLMFCMLYIKKKTHITHEVRAVFQRKYDFVRLICTEGIFHF